MTTLNDPKTNKLARLKITTGAAIPPLVLEGIISSLVSANSGGNSGGITVPKAGAEMLPFSPPQH